MKDQPATKDPRKVEYLDVDVLEAAIDRVRYLYLNYDNIWWAYSGGKDSQVNIELADIVTKCMISRGEIAEQKVNVYFRDEEVIPDIVWQECAKQYESGRWNFRYYAVPMSSRKFMLGKLEKYTMWAADREHIRKPPPFAIRELRTPEGEVVDTSDLTQKDMDDLMFGDLEGDVVLCTGVRADESLMRFAGVLQNKSEHNWLGVGSKIHHAKPIYDWTETDVFKFFYDFDVQYCKIYDEQVWAGRNLRVSSSLHEMESVNAHFIKAMYPTYYHQLVAIFPELEAHTRYWKEYDQTGVMKRFPPTFDGIREYCHEAFADKPDSLKRVLAYVDDCQRAREAKIKRQGHAKNLGGYPVYYVFKSVLMGSWYKDGAKPAMDNSISKEMHEYERSGI